MELIGFIAAAQSYKLAINRLFPSTPANAQEQIQQAIASGNDHIAVPHQDEEGHLSVTRINIPEFIKHSGVPAFIRLFRGFNFNSKTALVMGNSAQVQQFADSLLSLNPKKWDSVTTYIQNWVYGAKPLRRTKAITATHAHVINSELSAIISRTIVDRILPQQASIQPGNNASSVQLLTDAPVLDTHDAVLDPALHPFRDVESDATMTIEASESSKMIAPKQTLVSLDDHMNEFTRILSRMSQFSDRSSKLQPKHREAIAVCVDGVSAAARAFLRAPSPATFAAFNDASVTKINAMTTTLSHQPMIWNMLKPICNALIGLMNTIKKMIWTNPKAYSLFKSKTEAQRAWEATTIRPNILNTLEQIRLVVERNEAATPKPSTSGLPQ